MATVLHVSDTHLRADDELVHGVDPRVRLQAVLDAVASEGFVPDLIVHSGDITDDGTVEAARLAREALSGLGGRVLGVPGNHDVPASVASVLTTADADLPGWRVIGLDTVVPGLVIGTAEGRLASLESALAVGVPLAVVMHHPLVSHSTDPALGFLAADGFTALLARRTHPVLLLTGHTHEPFDAILDADPTRWLRLLGAPGVLNAWHHDGRRHVDTDQTGARLITLRPDATIDTRLVIA